MAEGFFTAPGRKAPRRARKKELREVAAVMAQISAESAALPEPYLREFLPILEEARMELVRDLRGWLRNVPDGKERFTAQQYRVALAQLDRSIRTMRERVPIEMEGTLQAASGRAGDMALEHIREEMARFGAIFGDSIRPIPLNQAAILSQTRHQLIPRFRNSAARYGNGISEDIKRQLSIGVVKGETFEQLTNRLVRLGGPSGRVVMRGHAEDPNHYAEYIAEGLFRKHRYFAERVVRTETMNAYNTHHLEGIHALNEDDPGYLSRWDASADRRLCDICAALDGVTVEPGENFPRIGRPHAPAHPNCRCVVCAWRKEWDEDAAPTPAPPRTFTDGDEAREWGEQNLGRQVRHLSAEEQDALRDYTGISYGAINHGLRTKGQPPAHHVGTVAHMDAALAKATIPEAIIVHRGTGWPDAANALPGQKIQDDGFMSTSLTTDTPRKFLLSKAGMPDAVLVEISIPKGAHGAYLDTISKNQGELEVLLPRQTELEVTDVVDYGDYKLVKAKVVVK